MNATYIYTEDRFPTLRKLANRALKAMADIEDYPQGTIKNPVQLASSAMPDGRTLIQTIYEDGFVRYNDGWFIVEVDDYIMYVDFTGYAVKEMISEGVLPPDGSYEYVADEGLGSWSVEDEFDSITGF